MVIVYPVLLLAVLAILEGHRAGAWRTPVALLPVVPIMLVGVAVARYLARADELERRIQLESLAIAFLATVGTAATSGFLQVSGMTPLSPWLLLVVGGAVWLVALLLLRLRYR